MWCKECLLSGAYCRRHSPTSHVCLSVLEGHQRRRLRYWNLCNQKHTHTHCTLVLFLFFFSITHDWGTWLLCVLYSTRIWACSLVSARTHTHRHTQNIISETIHCSCRVNTKKCFRKLFGFLILQSRNCRVRSLAPPTHLITIVPYPWSRTSNTIFSIS